MTFLFRVEDVFDIQGRECVLAPALLANIDFRIRASDPIRLSTPDGPVVATSIASIELLKPSDGGPCRIAIMLPRSLVKHDVPKGTEVWLP